MTDSLYQEPEKDGFKTESPIRAFTDFTVNGLFAIGKGFRPSLAHLTTYLDAMLMKEGWRLVQILEAATGHPSMVFAKDDHYRFNSFTVARIPPADDLDYQGLTTAEQASRIAVHRFVGKHPALGMPYTPAPVTEVTAVYVDDKEVTSDPINPKHYAGRACADIGERLSANGYQVLKYCWRLGKKDDPCQELGKAIWYAESELALAAMLPDGTITYPMVWGLPGNDNGRAWFEERIVDQPQFTQNIARMLWDGYDARRLQAILEAINEHKFHMDCGRGLAV